MVVGCWHPNTYGIFWVNKESDIVLAPFHLRTYPPKFGMKIVKLLHRFLTKREALPLDLAAEPVRSGFELFSETEWGDWWDCANMKGVFIYLRGSRDLQLGEWRELFPTHI